MSQRGMDAPMTVRQAMNYFEQFQQEFNTTLQNIPTEAKIEEIKNEAFELWGQWQREIQDKLNESPTRRDLHVMREEEVKLRKHFQTSVCINVALVGFVFGLLVNTCIGRVVTETAEIKGGKQQDIHNMYVLGTLGGSWSHNHTDLQLVSEEEGRLDFQYPIEHSIHTHAGNNRYLLQDKEAAKLLLDESLHSIEIKSETKLSVFIHYGRHNDATFGIPADKCSYDYVIPMHQFCEKSIGQISLFTPNGDSQVTITFRQISGLVQFKDRLYKPGEQVKVTVQRQKILTITHNDSLAGATIRATAPVCVIAGTGCKADKPKCKSVVTTVLPVTQLSRTFIVPNVVGKWSRVQLLSAQDKNRAMVYHYGERKQQILNRLETYDRDLEGIHPMVITSEQDLLVTTLARPTEADPFLLWIVGIDQYRSSYRFYIPYYKEHFTHELYVICKTNQIGDLRLNDKSVCPIHNPRVINVRGEGYEGFRLNVSCCVDYVMNDKNMGTFGLYIFGYPKEEHSEFASYGYPAGIFLK